MKRLSTLLAMGLSTCINAQTPQVLKDIHPTNTGTAQQGANQYFTVLNNKLLFAGNEGGVTGAEPWMSDGTTAGTAMIKDIVSGSGSSDVGGLPFFFNGKYYWMVDDGSTGGELYVSDLTAAGTSLFKDLNPGSGNSYAHRAFEVSGSLFIAAMNGAGEWILYKSDGTAASTVPLVTSNFYSSGLGISLGSKAIFAASTSATSNTDELYITDGTTAGTMLIKDINPGSAGSNPANFTMLDANRVLFAADDGVNGTELWVTDGTAAGTTMIKDINPGISGSEPAAIHVSNGKIYFIANDGINGQEPWISDGTAAGTMMLKDINAAGNGMAYGYAYFMDLNGSVIFLANNGTNGIELWKTDGTAAGTAMIKDINAGSGHGVIDLYTAGVVNGKVYFRANDVTHGNEMWSSDGTAAGTQMVYDLKTGSGDGVVMSAYFGSIGNRVFFVGDNGNTGWELYYYDAPLGVNSIAKNIDQVKVYPNPALNIITIETEENVSEFCISIYNALGQVVTQQKSVSSTKHMIDISRYPAGIYVVEINDAKETKRTRVVKH